MNLIGRLNRFVALRGAALLFLLGAIALPGIRRHHVWTQRPGGHRPSGRNPGDASGEVGRRLRRDRRGRDRDSPPRRGRDEGAWLPSANPANYFEMRFNAEAGRAYRLWVHGRADSNYWANDSVFVQFSGSVTSSGSAAYRIGTTSGAEVNLEDCAGCGLSGWMWQDNGYGSNVLGPAIYFAASGAQTIRVQTREDGIAIDQIVLSPQVYLNAQPVETLTPVPEAQTPPPAPAVSASEIVLTAALPTQARGQMDRLVRRLGTGRRPDSSCGRGCGQGDGCRGVPGQLLRADVQRRRGQAVPPVDPRPRRQQLLGERLRLRAVLRERDVVGGRDLSDRHDVGRRGQSRRLRGLRSERVDMAGQRLRRRRPWPDDPVRGVRAADHSHPDP